MLMTNKYAKGAAGRAGSGALELSGSRLPPDVATFWAASGFDVGVPQTHVDPVCADRQLARDVQADRQHLSREHHGIVANHTPLLGGGMWAATDVLLDAPNEGEVTVIYKYANPRAMFTLDARGEVIRSEHDRLKGNDVKVKHGAEAVHRDEALARVARVGTSSITLSPKAVSALLSKALYHRRPREKHRSKGRHTGAPPVQIQTDSGWTGADAAPARTVETAPRQGLPRLAPPRRRSVSQEKCGLCHIRPEARSAPLHTILENPYVYSPGWGEPVHNRYVAGGVTRFEADFYAQNKDEKRYVCRDGVYYKIDDHGYRDEMTATEREEFKEAISRFEVAGPTPGNGAGGKATR